MTMERDFWIPNLSGEVVGKERLDACLENYSGHVYVLDRGENTVKLRLRFPESSASPDFELTVKIPEGDSRGMCHLECNLEPTPLNIFMANNAWKEFRSLLDGCYGAVYNCTGMDEPFNKFHKSRRGRLHGTSVDDFHDVVNLFIQSVEQSSDTMNYLWKELKTTNDENHERVAHESLAKAESNKLYFDSFVSLYSDHLEEDWLEQKKREMDLRIGKARIAYSTIYKERKNEYEHSTVRIARIALIVSVVSIIMNLAITIIQLVFK